MFKNLALMQSLIFIAILSLVLLSCNSQPQTRSISRMSFTPLPDGLPAGWRSDGSQLMLGFTQQGLSLISVDNAGLSQIESPLNYSQHRTFCPAWSPAGTGLLYQERLTETEETKLHLLNISGTDTVFLGGIFRQNCPVWLPDGEHFSLSIGNVVLVFDQYGQYKRTLVLDSADINDMAWSPDEESIAFDSWDWRKVTLVSSATGKRITTGGFPRPGWHPTWSPNNKYVAFIEQKGPPGLGDLIAVKIDGTQVITLAGPSLSDEYYYSEPMWSPRGDYIAVRRVHRDKLHDYTVTPREAGLIPVPDNLRISATK